MTRSKPITKKSFHCAYKRRNGATMFIRDRLGRCQSYIVANGRLKKVGKGVVKLAPIYGRVDFSNGVRFTGRVRSSRALRAAYDSAHSHLSSHWVALPNAIQHSRRTTNQGMNPATQNLTGNTLSATNYAAWVKAQLPGSPVDASKQYEWCHLQAHSMGGADDETNIVSAVRGNNTEQLAIESALQMYRREEVFEMKVSVALVNGAQARHMGDVIRYKVRCIESGATYVRYLDCLNAPNPSKIHFYEVLAEIAMWANHRLEAIAAAHNPLARSAVRELMGQLPESEE
jgi:hypothetical protein